MVTTPMSDGYFYIFDYATDTADFDNQELNGKTVGVDYLTAAPKDYTSPGKLDIEIERFYGGEGYGMRYDMIERVVTAELKCTATERDNIWKYYYKHKDNDTDEEYLSWRRASNDYVTFYNEDADAKDYCEGFLVNVIDVWTDTEANLYTVRLTFEEVWQQ